MSARRALPGILVAAILLGGCATPGEMDDTATAAYTAATSSDPAVREAAAAEAAQAQAEGKPRPRWSVPTEEEVAAALEKKYLDAARDFVKLKKDGELRFCKRYREIGSSIARVNCITEAELRTQVDNMSQYRDDMRNRMGKCTRKVGCNGGG